jgi:L-lactate dehydrogenase complex protein LldG
VTAREQILAALRQGRGERPRATAPSSEEAMLFADLAKDKSALQSEFTAQLKRLSGEVVSCGSVEQAASELFAVLTALSRPGAPARLAAHSFPLLARLRQACPQLDALLANCAAPEDAREFAVYDAGISAADLLVARTGSVFIRAATCGGRRLSVLPPFHVVVASCEQLVPSLGDALSLLRADDTSSLASLISGPSRTADIEKILVLGAHGPRRLLVLLLDGLPTDVV